VVLVVPVVTTALVVFSHFFYTPVMRGQGVPLAAVRGVVLLVGLVRSLHVATVVAATEAMVLVLRPAVAAVAAVGRPVLRPLILETPETQALQHRQVRLIVKRLYQGPATLS
jgi:hypothetical protein